MIQVNLNIDNNTTVEHAQTMLALLAPFMAQVTVTKDDKGERGEYESQYLQKTGKSHFRMSREEREQGLTREQAAERRLQTLESGQSEEPEHPQSEPLPEDYESY